MHPLRDTHHTQKVSSNYNKPMNKFTYYILALFVYPSLMHCQNRESPVAQQDKLNQVVTTKISETFESYRGIKILQEGPRGSKFTNSKRGEFGLLVFRIQIFNDTIIPIDLEVKFPSKLAALLPDSLAKVKVNMLPDSITPDTIQNDANFGVIGLEDYFNSDLTAPGILKTRIQPKEHHTLYLGMIEEGNMGFGFGTYKTKLFLNGQDIDAHFFPVTSIKTEKTSINSLDLIFGIGYTPHNRYTLIQCGQISFIK